MPRDIKNLGKRRELLDESGKTDVELTRAKKLKSLRLNAGQSTSWQTQVVEILDELCRENLSLQNEIRSLRQVISSAIKA